MIKEYGHYQHHRFTRFNCTGRRADFCCTRSICRQVNGIESRCTGYALKITTCLVRPYALDDEIVVKLPRGTPAEHNHEIETANFNQSKSVVQLMKEQIRTGVPRDVNYKRQTTIVDFDLTEAEDVTLYSDSS